MIYDTYSIGGELYHHGVKGMKWGVRRYQPYGVGYQGSSGKFVGKVNNLRKKAISGIYDKSLDLHKRSDQKLLDRRKEYRANTVERYDKKIQKQRDKISNLEAKRDINKSDFKNNMYNEKIYWQNNKMQKIQNKKDARIKDYDLGTKYLKKGQKYYSKVLDNYKNAKLQAIDDKSYKNSKEYKDAVKDYTKQLMIDLSYSPTGTKLNYAGDFIKGTHYFVRNKKK